MKKNFLTKLAAAALVMGTVVTALPASATIYCNQTVMGKHDQTAKQRITGDDIALTVDGRTGTGTAFARQYVSGGSDKDVAAVSIDSIGSTHRDYFDANGSKYYIYWSGSDSSKAYVRFIG